jgi:hypothetical protein
MIYDRGVPAAALVSIVVSVLVVIGLMLSNGIDSVVPIYGGLATSVVLFFGISVAARKNRLVGATSR